MEENDEDGEKNAAASNYLGGEIYPKRQKWCAAWVDSTFHAMLMASSPSESFHSLLASGHSVWATMAQLLEKVDSIFVSQMDKHQQSCAQWDQQFLELTLQDIQGLPMICYAPLVSQRAFDVFVPFFFILQKS